MVEKHRRLLSEAENHKRANHFIGFSGMSLYMCPKCNNARKTDLHSVHNIRPPCVVCYPITVSLVVCCFCRRRVEPCMFGNGHRTSNPMKKGLFVLGIGAQKAGTTWLYEYLKAQNHSNMGFTKEYHVSGFDVCT